jgi:hypothetical protein
MNNFQLLLVFWVINQLTVLIRPPSKIAQQREAPSFGTACLYEPHSIPFITEHNTTLTLQTRNSKDTLTMQLQACTSHLPIMCHPIIPRVLSPVSKNITLVLCSPFLHAISISAIIYKLIFS